MPFPPDALIERLRSEGEGLAILVVRLGAFGDILRTLPPVRLIRFALPDARLHWVCDDRWARFLERHPDLDEVVAVPRAEIRDALRAPWRWPRAAAALGRLRERLRRTRYDLALDFHGNLRSGAVARLSGAAVRLGYAGAQQKEGNRLFTTHRVDGGPRRSPRMERNLALVRALGLHDAPLPDAGLAEDERAADAARRIAGAHRGRSSGYAVLNPGASAAQAYKRPPAALFAAAARALRSSGVRSLVVWGPGEEDAAEAVVRAAPEAAVRAPATDLDVLAALLRRARLTVTGDTGPLHLACATGCPVVAIYGPTDPVVNAPWRVPSVSIAPPGRTYSGVKRRDRDAGGFEGITEQAVAEACARLIGETSARA